MLFRRLTALLAVTAAAALAGGCGSHMESIETDFLSTPYASTPNQLVSALGQPNDTIKMPNSDKVVKHCFNPPAVSTRGTRCFTYVGDKMYSRATKHLRLAVEAIDTYRDFASGAKSRQGNARHDLIFASPTKECLVVTSASGAKPNDKAATMIESWSSPAAKAALDAGTLCAHGSFGDNYDTATSVFLAPSKIHDGMYDVAFIETTGDAAVVGAFEAEKKAVMQRMKEKVDAISKKVKGLTE